MIAVVTILSSLITLAIVVVGIRVRGRLLVHIIATLAAGTGAFCLVFAVQLLFFGLGIDVKLIDVLIEECAKAAGILLIIKIAKPVSLVATFAGLEFILGKVAVLYWLAPPSAQAAIEANGLFMLLVTSAAYGMHIVTGLIYEIFGLRRGLPAAIGIHFVFNILAVQVEQNLTLSYGALLFTGTALVLIATIIYKKVRSSKVR